MYLTRENQYPSHLRLAMALTVLLHIMLVILIPDLPKIALSSLNPLPALNVFIKKEEPKKEFEQSLNQALPIPAQDTVLQDPSLGSASPEAGEEPRVSEATPQIESLSPDTDITNQVSGEATPSKPSIRIDSAFVKLFTDQEIQREIERNPDRLERFNRSFNSRYSNQQRNRIESQSDRYGDLYVRTSSSLGDICFMQEAEEGIPSDFITNTVYFFRCKSKPFKFELGPEDQGSPD